MLVCSPPFSAHILVSLHIFLDNLSHADVNTIPDQCFLDLRLLLGRVKTSFSLGETSLVAQMVKRLSIMQETWVRSLGWQDLLEKEMATHSSILAWRIPWMEEPGGLQSRGSQRVRHD